MKSNRYNAFTLLELAIALAVAAVVEAFALPGWSAQIARGRRIDAVAALYRAAQLVDAQSASMASLPMGFDQAPPTGMPIYRLRLMPADDSNGGYALLADPVEAGPMRGDACGAFVLDATGARSNHAAGGGAVAAATQMCWRDR